MSRGASPGNAGSNTAADNIPIVKDALKQLPAGHRSGRKIMIRTDSAGGTHEFLHWLAARHRNLGYSVGFPIHGAVENVLPLIPQKAWTRAYNSDGEERDGAWVADVTGMLELSAWPKGLRVIVRKEIPHPGAQLRITDIDGMRYTAFATNQPGGSSRTSKYGTGCGPGARTGSGAPRTPAWRTCPCTPSQRTPSGATWSCSRPITAWAQLLAFAGTKARRWEPKKLRTRILEIAGKISRHARQVIVHLAASAPETSLLIKASPG